MYAARAYIYMACHNVLRSLNNSTIYYYITRLIDFAYNAVARASWRYVSSYRRIGSFVRRGALTRYGPFTPPPLSRFFPSAAGGRGPVPRNLGERSTHAANANRARARATGPPWRVEERRFPVPFRVWRLARVAVPGRVAAIPRNSDVHALGHCALGVTS